MYHTVEKGLKYRLLLNKIKCLGAFFWSRFGLMIPEHNIKIDTVIGKGIIFEKCEKPSEEEVNKAHEKYI